MKRKILFLLLLLIIGIDLVFSGTTGKITGKVTDAQTGEALVSANIIINGTSLGATSDLDGVYVILNIPPGTYSLTVSYLGYQTMKFENIKVAVDLTTVIDAALNPQALEADAVTVIAKREFVIKDMTSSLLTTSSEQIRSLPVQNVQQVLRLNAGIIESDGRLHIRGGRPGEVGYWVDGILATDLYDGRMGVSIENSAIQELQVISGTYNAEYGQAMSGIVNVVTKEGGKNITGQVKLYVGDYLSSGKEFSLYKKLVTKENPVPNIYKVKTTEIVSSEKDYPLERFNPIYNVEFSLGGPTPLFTDRLTFFVNGRYYYDDGYFYGRNWFKPSGVRGDSSLVAMNPNRTMSFLGKLNYQLIGNIKLGYNLYWNSQKRPRNYFRANSLDYQFNPTGQANFVQFNTHDYKYVPYALPQFRGEGLTNTIIWNHILSPKTFYELRISRYYSESKQYVYENPYASVQYLRQVDTSGGETSVTYIPDPNSPDGYINPKDITPPTNYSFMNKGMDITHTERSSAYWVGKFDLTSQLGKSHQFKLGCELRMHKLTLYSFQIIPLASVGGQDSVPFQATIPAIGDPLRNDYVRKPKEFSAYIQDKIEFNDIILNLGIRYDYFDANSVVPADPTDPNIYSPFKNKNRYANWVDIQPDDPRTINQYIQDKLDSMQIRLYTPDERRAFMHKKVKAKMSLSPRLGVSFPITEKGVIHFSYGHFLQIPEFQYLYVNPDFKLVSTTGSAVLGNADLRPQKTVQYEIGLQQQLTENIGIDITLFYRDVRDWVGTSPVIQTANRSVVYSIFENKDYSNVRGITLRVERRLADHYSFRADYTYQSAEGTYSNPTDAYNSILRNQSPVLALIPMNWDQRHTFNAQFIYNINNWSFSLVGRYWSGRPYTPSFPSTQVGSATGVTTLLTNSARRPDQKSVDLTVNRMFKLTSRLTLELFLYVYNVFDQRDQTNVYTDTESADYTTTINPAKISYHAARVSTVEDYINQPTWYSAPRQINFGFAFSF